MPARRENPAIKSGKAKGGILWLDSAAEHAARLGVDALDWATIPEGFDEGAISKWVELAKRYAETPLRFHENDRDVLQLYCETFSLRKAVLAELRGEGVLVKGRSSADGQRTVKSPLLAVQRDLTGLLVRLSTELGMGPNAAARAGLAAAKRDQDEAAFDPFKRVRRGGDDDSPWD